MYIVIIGCGKLGSSLARELSVEGHDVAIIDNNQKNLDMLGSGFNGERIKGVEFDNDVLLSAGIENADVFLAMTPDDNINAMAAQEAKVMFKVPRVIARIFNIEREFVYRKLGLETISPTEVGVDIVKSRIIEEGTDILVKLDENFTIVEIPIKNNKLKNVRDTENKFHCVVSSILRNGSFFIPSREEPIKKGDKIIITVNDNNKDRLINYINKELIL